VDLSNESRELVAVVVTTDGRRVPVRFRDTIRAGDPSPPSPPSPPSTSSGSSALAFSALSASLPAPGGSPVGDEGNAASDGTTSGPNGTLAGRRGSFR